MTNDAVLHGNLLPPVILPDNYNYIAVFLTFNCTLHCRYCINRFGHFAPVKRMQSGEEWVQGLNRIVSRPDLPLTLQGGEPTLHPDFISIVNGIRPDLHIDILTNLEIEPELFVKGILPERVKRSSPYASIRVSYHPETMKIEPLAAKVLLLQNAGYSIGIWGVLHPEREMEVLRAQKYCTGLGIDFRTKDFLGPGGDVYRCHGDLYDGRDAIGHILDPDFTIESGFRTCSNYGCCNPCDVKLKTNRFQKFGHTSVEIVLQ